MKRVLLFGKNGQLGSEILKNAPDDHYILPLDRAELDVTDFRLVEQKIEDIKPNILINATAYNDTIGCETNPLEALKLNFLSVDKMARVCQRNKIKFVTISSDYVFNGEKGSSYIEDDVPCPLQVYGLSKFAGEEAALNNCDYAYVIRTAGLYGGKFGSPQKGNFVLNIIKEAQDKEILEVNSEQTVSPTYARDLSIAIFKLLSIDAEGGIYHLVNEGCCSWYDFTKEIFLQAGIRTKVVPVAMKEKSGNIIRPKFTALENRRAKTLGIELPSWQIGIIEYLKFLKI